MAMFGQGRKKTQPSSDNDVDHVPICARRMGVAELREYLSNAKPDFLLCSRQCGLLIEALQRVAIWLFRWKKKTLPPPFVQDMLTLATHAVRLLEEFKQLTPSTWLGVAALKLESREEFLELFQGFLQGLTGYLEVVQGPFSCVSTHNTAPPSPSSLPFVSSAGFDETCAHEAMSLIKNLGEALHFLHLNAAEDRRALLQILEQGSFVEGEESRIAQLLMARLEDKEKHNDPFQLDFSQIMSEEPIFLGEGAFGIVFEATWMSRKVAVKQFHGQASLDAELEALVKTSHVNVMRAIAYCPQQESGRPCLLMERMKGDLGQFVHNVKAAKGQVPLPVSIEILLQIATGMAHLHAKNVVHRDLQPGNILFDRWPPMSAQQLQEGLADFTAKITDFGEARTQTCDTTHATARRGFLWYRAPEILRAVDDEGRARYSNKVDVFSFGMVCYKLLTKLDPDLAMENAARGDCSELKFPSGVPRAFVFLMKRCWAMPHRRRPSFVEICDFLALFKSIVLSTEPASDRMPLLYLGIRDDVLAKLVAFLGKEWLTEEAISLGIKVEFVKCTNRTEIDETWLRSQVTKKLAASPKADYLRWLRCFVGEPI